MNTRSPQNVQPSAGWTAQTSIDAAGNVHVGHTFSPIWPFSVYPPLPSGHPMTVTASIPPGLPHTAPSAPTMAAPVHVPQKSLPPRSANQPPVGTGLASVYTPPAPHTPTTSWNQLYTGSICPPFFSPQLYSIYGGYYYPYYGQGSIYPPPVLPKPPLSNDVANVRPTVQHTSSAPSKPTKTTPSPHPKEDAWCRQQPPTLPGLPATYEFTFECSPQVDQQQSCSPQPYQEIHEYPRETLLGDALSEQLTHFLSTEAPQEDGQLPVDDVQTFQRLLEEVLRGDEPTPPQQETSSLPSETEVAQSDEAAAQLILSVLTAPPQQDVAGDINPLGSSELCPSTSSAPSTSTWEPQMSSSTSATWSAAGSSTSASPSAASSLAPYLGVFAAGPSTQTTSRSKGKKRSREAEDSESTAEPLKQKRRHAGTKDTVKRIWCDKCEEDVAVSRWKIHECSRKHCGEARFSCRICQVLGIANEGHSRKDSLKRHIIQQHEHHCGRIWEAIPRLLEPIIPGEDLSYLRFLLPPSAQQWTFTANP